VYKDDHTNDVASDGVQDDSNGDGDEAGMP
jgi:hypothetical protein